ncbi:RNA-binding cell elongation regulator Jag/EloR [Lachnospira hominis (ex Hitch et al. 2024)]|jgi:spoIIIJ-associated protein|uniref:RNA-binding protein KhpB n=1 Tax=Lachnospira intestinalis TaxID=3133158 RepID=A0ABV1GR75_9FIRM
MDYIEVSGKNVDEALTNALIKLETTSDKVEYEVIEKGSAGFLGMGRKLAVIKVRKKEDKPVKANVKAKETETQKVADSSVSYEPVKAEPVKSVDNNEIKDDSHEQPKKTSKYTTVMPNEEVERRITTFLGDMFKAMNLEVKIDVKFDDPDCVNVELSGPNMGVLIGKRGQTLDSIQYLTSLVVNKGKDKYVRIKVDTEDYRNRRKETLESLAKNIAYKVKRSRKPVSLEPMNPYERRIIHSTLQNDKFVSTRSEGEEPFRHVVVYLDKEKNSRY